MKSVDTIPNKDESEARKAKFDADKAQFDAKKAEFDASGFGFLITRLGAALTILGAAWGIYWSVYQYTDTQRRAVETNKETQRYTTDQNNKAQLAQAHAQVLAAKLNGIALVEKARLDATQSELANRSKVIDNIFDVMADVNADITRQGIIIDVIRFQRDINDFDRYFWQIKKDLSNSSVDRKFIYNMDVFRRIMFYIHGDIKRGYANDLWRSGHTKTPMPSEKKKAIQLAIDYAATAARGSKLQQSSRDSYKELTEMPEIVQEMKDL